MGLAPETKLFKKNPGAYRGHVGDVSMVLRIAMTGRTNSPDLYTVMKILGNGPGAGPPEGGGLCPSGAEKGPGGAGWGGGSPVGTPV